MEFGSFVEFHLRQGATFQDAFEESFRHIDMAESLGLDVAWMSESHFNPSRSVLSSLMVVGSAIAARTERIKVGTAVQVLPLGNPLRMAEESASLDQISKGRLLYGVGRSGLPGAYEGYNMDYAESREKFYEYLEIIVQAWTHERFSYEGKFHSYDDVCLVPKPFQQPHPPIRIAANSPDTFPIIGKMNIPAFVGLRLAGVGSVAANVKVYQQARLDAGHQGPPDVSLRVPVYVAPTDEQAIEEAEESFMRQFQRLGGQLTRSVQSTGVDAPAARSRQGEALAEITWERVIGDKAVVGSPDTVIKQLKHMQKEIQLSGIAAEFAAGEKIPVSKVARSLELFCKEVIPAFK